MPWKVRWTGVSWANHSVGNQFCRTPPGRSAGRSDPTRLWYVWVLDSTGVPRDEMIHSVLDAQFCCCCPPAGRPASARPPADPASDPPPGFGFDGWTRQVNPLFEHFALIAERFRVDQLMPFFPERFCEQPWSRSALSSGIAATQSHASSPICKGILCRQAHADRRIMNNGKRRPVRSARNAATQQSSQCPLPGCIGLGLLGNLARLDFQEFNRAAIASVEIWISAPSRG